jgi:hypothetical protein
MPHRELDRDTHQARSARTTAKGRARAQRRQSQGDRAGRHAVPVFGGAIRRGDVGQVDQVRGCSGVAFPGYFTFSVTKIFICLMFKVLQRCCVTV